MKNTITQKKFIYVVNFNSNKIFKYDIKGLLLINLDSYKDYVIKKGHSLLDIKWIATNKQQISFMDILTLQ